MKNNNCDICKAVDDLAPSGSYCADHDYTNEKPMNTDIREEITYWCNKASDGPSEVERAVEGILTLLAQQKLAWMEQVASWFKFPFRKGMPRMEVKGLGIAKGGGCEVCGSRLVWVRGRYPHTPKRKICPTCALEILESLYDNLQSENNIAQEKPGTTDVLKTLKKEEHEI